METIMVYTNYDKALEAAAEIVMAGEGSVPNGRSIYTKTLGKYQVYAVGRAGLGGAPDDSWEDHTYVSG